MISSIILSRTALIAAFPRLTSTPYVAVITTIVVVFSQLELSFGVALHW
jgi:hypothetical protein